VLRRLVCGSGEESVPASSSSTGGEYVFLSVFCDLCDYLIGICVACDGTQWNFQYLIFAACTGPVLFFAPVTGGGNYVLSVLEMKQRPKLGVTPQDDVPTTATVATIGPAVWHKLFAMKMQIASAATSRTGTKLNVVDKIGCAQAGKSYWLLLKCR
jgi:hypothetical protein